MKQRRTIFAVPGIILLLLILPAWGAMAAPPRQGDLAIISYPADNDVVRGLISITGSAVHPSFDRYQLAYVLEPNANDQWIGIGPEYREQIVNGELAIWDTTTVPDGSYSLRLRVVRLDGNYTEIEVHHIVVANTQPTETPTPSASATPTVTPTSLPPTPTIVIAVPVDETPTPRPLTSTQVLPTPRSGDESIIPIPKVSLDTSVLKSSCLLGAGGMIALFLLFGFFSAMRLVVLGFAKRTGKKRRR